MGKFVDLTGQRFGKLVVTGQGERTPKGRIMWECLCDCGKRHNVSTCHLKSGAITDCGCGKSKRTTERNLKHGGASSRLYNIWIKMRDRCKNPNSQDWGLYGGKGVKVCQDWDSSFELFREWSLANGYDDTKTIDRRNSDGDYCPDNCRWTTSEVQANNTSRNRKICYKGETLTISEASKKYGIDYSVLKSRITSYNWPVEKAIETPVFDRKIHRRSRHEN